MRLQLQLTNSIVPLKLLQLISANKTPEPRTGKLEKVLIIFFASLSTLRRGFQRKATTHAGAGVHHLVKVRVARPKEAPDRPAGRRVSAMLIFLAPRWG